jgi:hypothetical protein
MSPIHPLAAAHALSRWTRHDAHRFLRPDWRRYVQPGSELAKLSEQIERKYRPDQPRVPAGVQEGGQWTAGTDPSAASQQSDVQSMLQAWKTLAARTSDKRQACLDLCYPLLERWQPPGADFNESAFRKCLNACLGQNR